MDVLTDIVEKVRLSSSVYFKSDFSAPWGMNIPKGPFAQFHLVTKGQCVLKTNQEVIQLFSGDIVIFPHGTSHWLANKQESELFDGEHVVESIVTGNSMFNGSVLATSLVCGHFEYDNNIDHPFLSELPPLIHLTDTDTNQFAGLKSISDLVIQESEKEKAGSKVMLKEVLLQHCRIQKSAKFSKKSMPLLHTTGLSVKWQKSLVCQERALLIGLKS